MLLLKEPMNYYIRVYSYTVTQHRKTVHGNTNREFGPKKDQNIITNAAVTDYYYYYCSKPQIKLSYKLICIKRHF